MSMMDPPTPPSKTSEKLRTDLHAVNTQLYTMKRQWEDERQKLLGENAVLQDATKRLNAQIERYANKERNLGDVEQVCVDPFCVIGMRLMCES